MEKLVNNGNEVKEDVLTVAAAERIDAIKKLIFGENMEEYDHKFHDLFEKLEEYHTELENRIEKMNNKLSEEIKNLGKRIESRISQLDNENKSDFSTMNYNKTDRRELAEMLIELAEKLQK